MDIHETNCATAEADLRAMTPEEEAAHVASQADAADAAAAERTQREARLRQRRDDLALLLNHPSLDAGLAAALCRLVEA